jgi:hypothetical protein
VSILATASDPSPGSGVKEVRFYWQYCPTGACGPLNLIGADTSSPYSASWPAPSCSSAPEDRFTVTARSEDNCGNVSADSKVDDLRWVGRCFRDVSSSGPAAAWTSDLALAGGRGQVVVDGAQALFPGAGVETFTVPIGPGTHRFEATLVDGPGKPGTWRFDLSTLGVVPGSVRVVAGDAAQVGPAQVAFRLRGRAGERVVFAFTVAGAR